MKKILSIFLSLSMILSSVSQNNCLGDTPTDVELNVNDNNLIFEQPKKSNVTENLINKSKEALKSTRDFISQKGKKVLKSTENFISENSSTIIPTIAVATLSALPTINGVKNFSKIKELLADRTISIGSKLTNLTKILFLGTVKNEVPVKNISETTNSDSGNTDLVNKTMADINTTGAGVKQPNAPDNFVNQNDTPEKVSSEDQDAKHLELQDDTSPVNNETSTEPVSENLDKSDDSEEPANGIQPTIDETSKGKDIPGTQNTDEPDTENEIGFHTNTSSETFNKTETNKGEFFIKQTKGNIQPANNKESSKNITDGTSKDDTTALFIPEFTPIPPQDEFPRKMSVLDYITATSLTVCTVIGTIFYLYCRSKFTPSLNNEISEPSNSDSAKAIINPDKVFSQEQINDITNNVRSIITSSLNNIKVNFNNVGGKKQFITTLVGTIINGFLNSLPAETIKENIQKFFHQGNPMFPTLTEKLFKFIDEKMAKKA